jgi:hypothetical protein
MKQKRLCIRSDEAYEIATRHALRTGRPRTHVVYAALLAYAEVKMGKKLNAEERSFLDAMRALELQYQAKSSPSNPSVPQR